MDSTRCQMLSPEQPYNIDTILPHIYQWDGHKREARVQTQAVQT